MQARALQIQLVPAMHPPTAKPRSGANKVMESSSDGNIRQYDANGKLIGSTYDEDQAKLGNPDGNLE